MIGPTPESCLQGLSRQTPFPYHLVNWLSRQREVTDIYMKLNTVIEYKTVAAYIYMIDAVWNKNCMKLTNRRSIVIEKRNNLYITLQFEMKSYNFF